MPPKRPRGGAQGFVPRKRGRPTKDAQPEQADDSTAADGPVAPDSGYPFQSTTDLKDLVDIPVEDWTPASDEDIRKVKGSKVYSADCEASRMRTHTYDFQDLSRFVKVNWWPATWDYTEPEVLPNEEVDQLVVKRMQAPNGCIKGQTVVCDTTSKPRGFDLAAALACFESTAAFLSWLDTQGARFFSKLAQYRVRKFDNPGRSPDYAALPKFLNDRVQYSGLHRILRSVAEMEEPRELLVRNGDTDRAFQPIDQRHHAHAEGTVLVNVLIALRFTTSGLESEEKRFARVEGDAGMSPPYHYGYHADDWLGMIVGGAYAFTSRRTRSSSRIDGQASATQVKAVGRIEAENMTGIISEEQGEKVAHSAAVQNSLNYHAALEALPSADDFDPRDMSGRMRRVDNRMAWFIQTGRSVKKMTARSIAANKNKASAPNLAQVPPLDSKTLDIVIRNISRIHGKPERFEVDKESADAIADLIGKRDGGMQSFLSAQVAIADRLTQTMEETQDLTREEAKDEVEEVLRHSWALGKISSSTAPEKVDFADVLRAFGLDPDFPQPERLTLNPVGNPDFKVLAHQLADAYCMRKKELSIIRGALLAAEVGTGKTVTIFSLVVLEYQEIMRKKEAGEPFESRPTLMLVPPGLIGQTFNECVKFFGGLINIKCYYGIPSQFKGVRQVTTLTDQQWEDEAAYAFDPKTVATDPKNCLNLYLTTYSTALYRFTERITHHLEAGDEPPHDFLVYNEANLNRLPGTLANEEEVEEAMGGDDLEEVEALVRKGMDPDDNVKKRKRTKATYTQLKMRICSYEGAMFSRVICDEAHLIRNHNSIHGRMVALFPRMHTALMTATPTINRLGDIGGLMYQIYKTSHLAMPDYFFHDSLMQPDYRLSAVHHTIKDNDVNHTMSPFDDDSTPEDRKAVCDYVRETGNKPWALLPGAISELSSGDLSSGRSDKVYAAATACFVSRRSMRDGVEYVVPADGETPAMTEVAYPGQDIPPSTVITEELSMKGFRGVEDAVLLRNITNKLWKKINVAGSGDGPVLPEIGTMHGGSKDTGRVNLNVHRLMLLNAFDLRTQEVFTNEDKLGGAVSVNLLEKAVRSNPGPMSTLSSSKKGKAKDSKDKAPTLGVAQIEHLRDSHDATYRARQHASLGHSKSPILTRVVELVVEHHKQGLRTLIMVDNHYCQQLTKAILEKIGLRVGSIRAADTTKEREDAVDEFTSEDSDMMVFVINASTNVAGLNLHTCCCRGIIAQFTWSVAMLIQAMGRLGRKGQKHPVIWYILKLKDSYYDIQEDRMCRKYAEVLRNDGYMPEYLKSPILRRIVAYEHIRVLLAQSFNRFAWCAPGVDPPSTIQEFNEYRMRRMGQFFTTVARILMALPESLHDDEASLAYFITDIAKRFVDQDDDEEQTYAPPTLGWIEEQLDELKTRRETEKPSGSGRPKRSRKFKRADLVGDTDSESDGEGGVERRLVHRLEKKAQREKTHKLQENDLLNLVFNAKNVLWEPDEDEEELPRNGIISKKDDAEFRDLEERMG